MLCPYRPHQHFFPSFLLATFVHGLRIVLLLVKLFVPPIRLQHMYIWCGYCPFFCFLNHSLISFPKDPLGFSNLYTIPKGKINKHNAQSNPNTKQLMGINIFSSLWHELVNFFASKRYICLSINYFNVQKEGCHGGWRR